jgi:muramoyltetrapeptide carboxypeptidase LdcA involved in peptidoglycan recycling
MKDIVRTEKNWRHTLETIQNEHMKQPILKKLKGITNINFTTIKAVPMKEKYVQYEIVLNKQLAQKRNFPHFSEFEICGNIS